MSGAWPGEPALVASLGQSQEAWEREHLGPFVSGFCYLLSGHFKAFRWGHA